MSSRSSASLDRLKRRELLLRLARPGQVETLEPRRLLASPEIDLSFGEGGLAPVDATGEFQVVLSLPGGKILAAGGSDPVVARFNADGSPDTSFDGDGKILLPQDDFFSGNVFGGGLTPDGKILLVYGAVEVVRLFRFHGDGTIDTGFGTGGVASHTLSASIIERTAHVQSDGKVLIGYNRGPVDDQQTYLSRFNADGSVDTSFRGGLASPVALPRRVFFFESAVMPDGTIYVLGDESWSEQRPNPEFGIFMRLEGDGDLDTTFGGGDGVGELIVNGQKRGDNILTVDPQGRLFVVGHVDVGVSLVRLGSDGAPDPAFGGGDGEATVAFLGTTRDITFAPDGKITGALETSPSWHFKVFRTNADGTIDTSFGENGIVDPGRKLVNPDVVALDADGNVLVAGQHGEPYFLALTRLVPASPDVTLNSEGQLFVTTTDGADTVTLRREGDQAIVRRNGVDTSFAFADVKGLTVYGSGGGDAVSVGFALACTIEGGDGNDTITVGDGQMSIKAGNGNDTIVCGAGAHNIEMGSGNDRVTTGAGNDTIFPGSGNDTVTTGPGGDRIEGGGDTTIFTGSGNDTIITGSGNDLVFAGAGHDFIVGSTSEYSVGTGNKVYFGGDGDDVMAGGSGANSLFGGAGHDRLYGAQGDDYISGGPGDDVIVGRNRNYFAPQTGRDTLVGGDGHDKIDGGDSDDLLFGDGGNDTLHGGNGNNVLHGGAGDDSLTGGFGDLQSVLDETPTGVTLTNGVLTFNGTSGNDQISIWADGGSLVVWREGATQILPLADVRRIALAGNGGNDLLKLHAQLGIPAILIGGAGDDQLIGGKLGDTLLGGDGADHLFGNAGSDQIDGGFGADVMRGGAGFDTLDYSTRGGRLVVGLDGFQDDGEAGENDFAGPDFEQVLGGVGDDRIGGGAGNELLFGGAGNDVLSGGGGNDHLFGLGGHDTVSGDAGDDALYGDTGDDSLLGGAGNNRYLDLDPAGVLRFHGSDVADQISLWEHSERDRLVVWLDGVTHAIDYSVVERIELNGYGGNDVLKLNVGLAVYSVLRGGSGNDHITGGFYPDTILGGEGNDTLVSGKSVDTVYGNGGNDTIDYSHSKQAIRVTLDDVQDDGEIDSHGESENDLVAPDIENVVGTRFADRITGSAAANALHGGDGNDTLVGHGHDDSLYGEGGNDTLDGGDAPDYLEGGAGNDVLIGGAGADRLFGLAGNDRLHAAGDGFGDIVRGGLGIDSAQVDELDDVLSIENVA